MSVAPDGSRLNYEMAVRGVNQSKLAERAGVCPSTVSSARHDKPISTDSLERIANALVAIPVNPAIARLVPKPSTAVDPPPAADG
jgi:transcriptional regulator with XRE-family HTH domain